MIKASHVLEPEVHESAPLPRLVEGADLADYAKYLTDESRRIGHAAALTFPTSTAEVAAAVREAGRRAMPITISNARTGIAAGAVPDGGMLISLERLNRIRGLRPGADGAILVACEAGVLLSDLQDSIRTGAFADSSAWDELGQRTLEHLRGGRWFYPPDPTERGAAIGGTIACNASGAHTFLYGPTRPYVQALTAVLADGRVLRIQRGQHHADAEGRFGIAQPDGTVQWGTVPTYAWPRTKNSAGYYSGEGMDLLDLFIGSEGTLGIVTEAVVRAIPAPEASCAVMTFWPDEGTAVRFTRSLRTRRQELGVEAIEYFDPNALALLRERRRELGAVSGVPGCLADACGCGIYLDVGTSQHRLRPVMEELCAMVASHGGDPETCWSAMARDERERLRIFRHALPETVNTLIAETRRRHPVVTKLGTDMAVPDDRLEDVLRLYRENLDAARLPYVVFGHIGDNHVHVNILPRDPEQYAAGRALYQHFAREVVRMGGSPAAEHGVGKLKADFLAILFGAEGVHQMRAVKAVFDPQGRLNAGTLFPGAAA